MKNLNKYPTDTAEQISYKKFALKASEDKFNDLQILIENQIGTKNNKLTELKEEIDQLKNQLLNKEGYISWEILEKISELLTARMNDLT